MSIVLIDRQQVASSPYGLKRNTGNHGMNFPAFRLIANNGHTQPNIMAYFLFEVASSPYGMKWNTGNRGMNSPAFRVASCGLLTTYLLEQVARME